MKKFIVSLIIIFLSFFQANSFNIADLGTIDSSVIDKVGVLKDDEKTQIETKIEELRNKYTVEILTVIIPTTDGQEISSLATQIGQKVGVGKADKDNGIVILIAIQDRAWNIATGYGVEGIMPDLLAKRIGEKNFVLFKESKYFEGISGTLNDFEKAFEGDESIISLQKENTQDRSGVLIFQVILAIIFSSIFLKPLSKSGEYKKLFLYLAVAYIITLPLAYYFLQNLFFFLQNAGVWLFGSIFGIYGKSGRGGGFGSSGGSSGGGFGGFSGGSFGGGGSSGKW